MSAELINSLQFLLVLMLMVVDVLLDAWKQQRSLTAWIYHHIESDDVIL